LTESSNFSMGRYCAPTVSRCEFVSWSETESERLR
jgi:hypothetical protein